MVPFFERLVTLISRSCHDVMLNISEMVQDTKNYTGWLKLKYPTGQNATSRQPCEIIIPKFIGLYGRDPATILNLKNILVLSKVMAV